MNREILEWPHQALKTKAKNVTDVSSVKDIIVDLIDSCNVAMGIGLAANQIGYSENICVIRPRALGIENTDPSQNNADFMVCINPTLKISQDSETIKWKEGCLSFEGLETMVERKTKGVFSYLSELGEKKELEVGWPIIGAIQHELEHLSGKNMLSSKKPIARSLEISSWEKKKLKKEKRAQKLFNLDREI